MEPSVDYCSVRFIIGISEVDLYRACIDHAPDMCCAAGFKQVVGADQIAVQQFFPRGIGFGTGTQMHEHIDALAHVGQTR